MIEFFFGGTFEDDRVGHDGGLLRFPGSQIVTQRTTGFVTALFQRGRVEQVLAKLPVVQQVLDHRFPFAGFE